MEIIKNSVVVKLDSEEKETLEKALSIVTEIAKNEIICDSCSHDCPFVSHCSLAHGDQPHECLLETTMFNLKEILKNV